MNTDSALDPSAYRYTDRDVREHSELIDAAMNWLREYQGDFEFLRDARVALLRANSLPIGVVRGVLNCMWGDARAFHLLPITPTHRVDRPQTFPRPRSHLRVVEPPFKFAVRGKVHGDVWYSTHVQAKWAHQIDHARSEFVYWRHPHQISVRLFSVCGKDLWRPNQWTRVGSVGDLAADAPHLLRCPKCVEQS